MHDLIAGDVSLRTSFVSVTHLWLMRFYCFFPHYSPSVVQSVCDLIVDDRRKVRDRGLSDPIQIYPNKIRLAVKGMWIGCLLHNFF